jgi:ubiquinone/menaquinone biosynthesis C-methylase UbiE
MDSAWDKIFDELYLRTYAELADPETGKRQAEGVVSLLGLEPGADVLDCPCGYGRHSIEFARMGLHVVGADRSEVLLAEARGRAGDAEWPQWVQADYRELPFAEASFDCVTNLFSSLGYWGEGGDRQAIGEFRRVLRPRGRLVIETMHRDRLMAIYTPRSWEELPEGGLMIEERAIDYERGTTSVRHELVEPDGTRISAPYELRVYTVTELIAFARGAGFEHVACYGDFDGETPVSRDTRLVLVAS